LSSQNEKKDNNKNWHIILITSFTVDSIETVIIEQHGVCN